MHFPLRILAATAVLVASSVSLPLQAAADPEVASQGRVQASWIVKTSAQCTGEVIHSTQGNLVLTARHCGDIGSVTTSDGSTFLVTQQIDAVGSQDLADLTLLRVAGDIETTTGGGFRVGLAPLPGQSVSVWGYPAFSAQLDQCGSMPVSYEGVAPEVTGCSLPDGTSGSPWFTQDSVLRGVTSGLNEGGLTDNDSESTPFTPAIVSWIKSAQTAQPDAS